MRVVLSFILCSLCLRLDVEDWSSLTGFDGVILSKCYNCITSTYISGFLGKDVGPSWDYLKMSNS